MSTEHRTVDCLCRTTARRYALRKCTVCDRFFHERCATLENIGRTKCASCDKALPIDIALDDEAKSTRSDNPSAMTATGSTDSTIKNQPCTQMLCVAHGSVLVHKAGFAAVRSDSRRILQVCDILRRTEDGECFVRGFEFVSPGRAGLLQQFKNRTVHERELVRLAKPTVLSLRALNDTRVPWVLDVAAFCAGKPSHVDAADVFVCEFRLDRRQQQLLPLKMQLDITVGIFELFSTKKPFKRNLRVKEEEKSAMPMTPTTASQQDTAAGQDDGSDVSNVMATKVNVSFVYDIYIYIHESVYL